MTTRTIFLLVILTAEFSYAQTLPGQYPHASQKHLSLSDIDTMAEKSVRIMRNEIFARYGYIFKSADLNEHFSKTAWYRATSTDVTGMLTDVEKKNIDLLKSQEARIKISSDFDSFYDLFRDAMMKDDLDKIVRLVHFDHLSEEGARHMMRKYAQKLKEAVESNPILDHEENEAILEYDKRNDGATVDFLVFRKIGPCWYITGFDGIG